MSNVLNAIVDSDNRANSINEDDSVENSNIQAVESNELEQVATKEKITKNVFRTMQTRLYSINLMREDFISFDLAKKQTNILNFF